MTTIEKLRAEIEETQKNTIDWSRSAGLIDALEIIDKYAEQEPKTGKWEFVCQHWRKCSECGFSHKFAEDWNYCPNCGCHMVEPRERSEE